MKLSTENRRQTLSAAEACVWEQTMRCLRSDDEKCQLMARRRPSEDHTGAESAERPVLSVARFLAWTFAPN